jgi:hypothetical protein
VRVLKRKLQSSWLTRLADIVIDRNDLDCAAQDLRATISAPIKFAFDTVGADTAAWCQSILSSKHDESPHPKDSNIHGTLGHLVCLVGSPKERCSGVRIHQVPIKLFHTNQDIGHVISSWLSVLLGNGKLKLPETIYEDGGLAAIGPSLERIRRGELSGRRLVVRLGDK